MLKTKNLVIGFLLAVLAMVVVPVNMLPHAYADMSFDTGKDIFQSTWKVNYPNDLSIQWYAAITDDDFLGMGSYTIDETALPSPSQYRITIHLNNEPNVYYWVRIYEGIHGYSMKIEKADKGWHHVLDGWRSIK
ncbi:hypothetical protein [Propionispira raffinosivorans]|uniref:hypothetical protein n=1 Tax=Propionispira raffinosivorans TaxID=86959 RepID=UPI000373BE8D|nr:hypothetical protein [Propionispira raffinosivorans]